MNHLFDTPFTTPPNLDSTFNDPNAGAGAIISVHPALIPGLSIIRELGQGSSATVYLARGEEGEFAVKVLAAQYIDHAEVSERWNRETQTMVALRHPNIVRGYRRGVAEGRPYLVMEYVMGESLSSRLRRMGRLPESEVLEIARAVLQALLAAEGAGILHRDIKPANVIRAESGAIKLTDFGLVRTAEDDTITVQGAMIGTPAYISPEQTRGDRHLDVRTDLYSLGISLFQLATGDIPFSSLNTSLLLTKKITEDVPDPRSIYPQLDARLAFFITALSHRDRERRPASAKDALELLRRVEANDVPITEFKASADEKLQKEVAPNSVPVTHPMLQTVISDKELRTVTVFVPEGGILFYEDDSSREAYVLLSGSAEVLKAGRRVAEINDQGSFLGEMSALRKAPRSATIRARVDSTFLRISEEDFHSFLRRHPGMNYQLACTLAERLERTNMKLTEAQTKLSRMQKHVKRLQIDLK